MLLTANAGFLLRILNYVLFAVTATLASFRAGRPDVVVATSPQFFCGLAGAVVARLKRRPFILEVRDLWPKSIVELGQLGDGVALRTLLWLERWLYHSASGIVVNTRAFIDHITSLGYPRDEIELVYNGIDPERFKPRPPAEELLAEHDLSGLFTVAYMGTLGLAHGLLTVIETAERLREQAEIVFLLIGDGAERAMLEDEIERRGLENIRMLGLQPREHMPAWIASIDLQLVCLRDLPVFATVIPSKIFEFLAQERPVIVAARGEIRRMVEEAEVAQVIEPEDPEALADAILRAYQSPQAAAKAARAGRGWIEEHFVRDDLADRMVAFMQRVTGPAQ
jgi:glycosyltransferase involved in cell wall biosynthesis